MTSSPIVRPSRPSRLAALVLLCALLGSAGVSAQRAGRAVVSGTVTSVAGEPVPEARVSLTTGKDGAGASVSTATDEEGEFELEVESGLPGTYRLRVEAEGHEPVEGSLELEPGQQAMIDVDLLPTHQATRQRAVTSYNAGVEAFEQGELEAAEERFEEALEADPELAEAHLGLAETAVRRERPAEVVEHAEAYLALRPDDAYAHRLAYEAYRDLGDEEGMARQKAALAATEAGPEVAREVYNEGVKSFQAGDLEKALARFRDALELDPGLSPAAVAIATIHYEEGRYEEAAREAAALLEREPGHVKARRLRFVALEAQGSPEADAALEAYAEVDPDAAVELLSEWAEDDFEADRRESAEKQLLRLLALRPDRPEAHYRLGLVYAGSGEAEKAKEHLRRFLELAPDHPEAEAAREILEGL